VNRIRSLDNTVILFHIVYTVQKGYFRPGHIWKRQLLSWVPLGVPYAFL